MLPQIDWAEVVGRCAVVVVKVGWRELQLTEQQVLANAIALANGENTPFPDPSLIEVEVPWPAAELAARDSKQNANSPD